MNHCHDAQQLLRVTAEELKVDVETISEPLFNPGDWSFDEKNKVVIWVTGVNGVMALQDTRVKGGGFV